MKKSAFFYEVMPNWLVFRLILSLVVGLNPTSVNADNPSMVMEWIVSGEKLDSVRADFKGEQLQTDADPNSDDDTRGLPLLYVVSGVVFLPQLAKAIISVYKDWKYGPAIITQDSAGKLTIKHDPQMAGSGVMFIDANGKITFHEDITSLDANKLSELLITATSK